MRVLIVGGPGSGKTTLARRLADRIGCAFHELDVVGFEGGAGPERPLDDRLRDVAAIATRDAWVAEGSFMGWTDALAEAADVIVWLDVPWRVARYRLVCRHAKASLRRMNKHRGLRKLWHFMQYAKLYYADSDQEVGRLQTATWLRSFNTPLVVCRSNAELETLIRSGRFDAVQHPSPLS